MENEILLKYLYSKIQEAESLAKLYTERNGKKLKKRDVFFKIKNIVDKFLNNTSLERFIVLPGLRGTGKTTILFQLYEYLLSKNIPKENILYVSLDEFQELINGNLYEFVQLFISEIHKSLLSNLNKKIFLLFDEVHYYKDWSLVGKLIYDKSKNIFMIFTGSSAIDLEINADTARRSIKIPVFPLSFSEYLNLKFDLKLTTKLSFQDVINFNKNKLEKYEKETMLKLLELKIPLEKVFKDYIFFESFPYAINEPKEKVLNFTYELVHRIIEKDLTILRNTKSYNYANIMRIINYLALQKPGSTSDTKLSNILGMSSATIRDILNALEKTHLIFSLKPYSKGTIILRKPWKYYFMDSSIVAALNKKLGYFENSNNYYGKLIENYVASRLNQIKEESSFSFYYDPNERSADFIIEYRNYIIPIEVGLNKKTLAQLKNSLKKYNSKKAILITNTEKVKIVDEILIIPLKLFGLI